MSATTQQTGRYRMRYCAACGSLFIYNVESARRERRSICRKCRKELQESLTTLAKPFRSVEMRGVIPGGNTTSPVVNPKALERIYFP